MEPMWLRRPKNGISVIFVHGILSGPRDAWTNSNGTFWPKLLIDDERLEEFGVYLFGYRADALSGTYSLEDAADAMREHFLLDGVLETQPKHPLIFVCHSMGGILARRFVVANQLTLAGTKLAFFLIASPSLGAEYANFAAAVAPLYNAQLETLKFSQTNHWLNTLDKDFLNLKEGGRVDISGKELVEDQFLTKYSMLRFKQIVPPWTGARYFGSPIKIRNSDHVTIAKPSAATDLQHRLLVRFIGIVCGKEVLKAPKDEGAILNDPTSDDSHNVLKEQTQGATLTRADPAVNDESQPTLNWTDNKGSSRVPNSTNRCDDRISASASHKKTNDPGALSSGVPKILCQFAMAILCVTCNVILVGCTTFVVMFLEHSRTRAPIEVFSFVLYAGGAIGTLIIWAVTTLLHRRGIASLNKSRLLTMHAAGIVPFSVVAEELGTNYALAITIWSAIIVTLLLVLPRRPPKTSAL